MPALTSSLAARATPRAAALRTAACRLGLGVLAALWAVAGPAAAQGTPPAWTAPDPSLYPYTLGVTAVLVVSDVERHHAGDRVAAFIGGEVRGVAAPVSIGGRHLFFLLVHGDSDDVGQPVAFAAYDATTGAVLDAGLRTATGAPLALSFVVDSQTGTIAAPVRVAGQQPAPPTGPGWVAPNPAAYEGYAAVTATASLDGVPLGAGAIVAAFVGGELRGVAPVVAGPSGRALAYVSVFGDAGEGAETVRFRVWDAATQRAYDAAETVPLGDGGGPWGTHGTPANPLALTAGTVSTTTTLLDDGEGWYTVSAPAEGLTLGGLLGRVWTQGFPGADFPGGGSNVLGYSPTGGYAAPTAADAVPGRGYFVWVYADDDPGVPGTQGGFPKPLAAAGTPPTTPFAFPVEAGGSGWMLLGNPFPSPIDWDAPGWTRQQVGATVYTWDLGAYAYRVWNGLMQLGDLEGGVVPPFSAFWAYTTGAAPQLVAAASVQTPHVPGPPAAPPVAVVQLRLEALAGAAAGRSAQAFVALAAGASAGADALDSPLPPPRAEGALVAYTTDTDGTGLAVQALPDAPQAHTVALATGGTAGPVRLTWPRVTLPTGWAARLADTQTGTVVDLATATELLFEATAATNPDRFLLTVAPATVGAGDAPARPLALTTVAPNPAAGATRIGYTLPEPGRVRLEVVDALGRRVALLADGDAPAGAHAATLDAAALAPGVYVVRLSAGPLGQAAARLVVQR